MRQDKKGGRCSFSFLLEERRNFNNADKDKIACRNNSCFQKISQTRILIIISKLCPLRFGMFITLRFYQQYSSIIPKSNNTPHKIRLQFHLQNRLF